MPSSKPPTCAPRSAASARLADWPAFADSWNDLSTDTYMADGGRYRRRRFGVWCRTARARSRAAHQPHYQSLDYNT
jgi:hypothetical protein